MGRLTVWGFKKELTKDMADSAFVENPAQLAQWILTDFLNIRPHDLLLDPHKTLSPEAQEIAKDVVRQLLDGRPYQYILGHLPFLDLTIQVGPGVLIPRPETEFLVDQIIREHQHKENLKVMDLCCGSGCGILAMAAHLNLSKALGIDFSDAALQIAKTNANALQLPVVFSKVDLLNISAKEEGIFAAHDWDVWFCNPPYVLPKEKEAMSANVLAHEPTSALFVPENDPLLFYRIVIQLALQHQVKQLYFELNEYLKTSYEGLVADFNIRDYAFSKDLNGKWRYLKVF